MNNKGQVIKYTMVSIVRFIILAIVVFAVVMLFKMLIVNDLSVTQLKSGVLYSRLMYSPNAISYVDPHTGREYPGIIDLDKFNEENLKNATNYSEERHISAKLMLLNSKGQSIQGVNSPIYLNRLWYDRWLPLSNKKFQGLGSTERNDYNLSVLYEENEEFKQGMLKITILQPES